MTRHQKNATANSVYTYHERKKDAKESGWGTLKERLGKNAVKNYDCCSLTLQPCRDPVITPDGHLYDKQAILEYIVHHKKENAKKLKEWEKHQQELAETAAEVVQKARDKKVQQFVAQEATPTVRRSIDDDDNHAQTSGVSNMAGRKRKELPSFWLPDQMPEAKKMHLDKPDQKVYCPMSGKPLNFKELVPVKFTPMPDDDTKKTERGKELRYMCAVSRDVITNTMPCAVLKPSGVVVTMDVVERIIKKDMLDPISGQKLCTTDIIEMQRGGTGFASTNAQLEAKTTRPVLELQ